MKKFFGKIYTKKRKGIGFFMIWILWLIFGLALIFRMEDSINSCSNIFKSILMMLILLFGAPAFFISAILEMVIECLTDKEEENES
jgi:hypothetical protein